MARVKSSPEHWDIPKSVVFAPTGSDATISYAKSCLSGSVAMSSVNKPRSFAPFCGLKMPRSYVIIVPRSSRSYTALSFRDSLKFLLNTGFLFFALVLCQCHILHWNRSEIHGVQRRSSQCIVHRWLRSALAWKTTLPRHPIALLDFLVQNTLYY